MTPSTTALRFRGRESKLSDALPTPLAYDLALSVTRESRVPVEEQRSHVAPERRSECDSGHGLIAIGQSRRGFLRVELPEGFAREHMMVRVPGQIIVERIGEGSVANSARAPTRNTAHS